MKKNPAYKRKEAERKARIDQILRAARNIFLKKGYWGATMRDIANEAELSTGAVYFYFEGKNEIYGKICEEIMLLTVSLVKKGRRSSGTIRERIKAITDAYVGFYVNYREDFDLLDSAYRQITLPEKLNQSIEKLVAELLSYVTEIFEDAVSNGELSKNTDTLQLTLNAWSAIEGILYIQKRNFLTNVDFSLEDLIEKQICIIESGIRHEFGNKETS